MTQSTDTSSEAVSLSVLVSGDDLEDSRSFEREFTIGRDESCDVTIDSGLVSRTHARVVEDAGTWRILDCDSTNGLYVEGQRHEQAVVEEAEAGTVVHFGIDGPSLTFRLEAPSDTVDPSAPTAERASSKRTPPAHDAPAHDAPAHDAPKRSPGFALPENGQSERDAPEGPQGSKTKDNRRGDPPSDARAASDASGRSRNACSSNGPPSIPPPSSSATTGARGADAASAESSFAAIGSPEDNRLSDNGISEANADDDPSDQGPGKRSVTAYYDYYFSEDSDGAGGDHTRLLRQAYQRARHSERRQFLYVVAGVLIICLSLAIVALWQYQQRERLETLAMEVSEGIQRQNLALAQLRQRVGTDQPNRNTIWELEQERQRLENVYQGYVEELGLRRDLTADEQIIHRVARTFGESEFSMPAGFVREVRETIHDYWLGPGKPRFQRAIQRAQANGYVEPIVREMMRRGLPPEFFYLALQESDFKTDAVGPSTNWGYAKGMWQFIPTTAQRFDLDTGNRDHLPTVDPADERHDFQKSTEAAARYLQAIYTTEAQASGLLVIASYNWGEHRVNNKLNRMNAYGIPDSALEGIDETPDERNYWKFLTTYRSRMPKETRDYVLRVFSAAVIGQAPRHFGFDFDNPLTKAIDAAGDVPYAPPPPRLDSGS